MASWKAAAFILAVVAGPSFAVADEQLRPLAISGDWVAVAHSPSMTEPPDVCGVMNMRAGVAFRADTDGVQLRVLDPSWSLPPNTAGEIKIDVGALHKKFDIDDNTDTAVNVEISDDDTLELFDAMDKSPSLTVVAGSAKPRIVSLVGSTKATNAFRTCAHIQSSGQGGGANPFKQ